MTSEVFSVSWNGFLKNVSLGLNSLLENEDFVDVTLAVEGRYLKAHKMVLSVCSPYFRDLFKTSPCKHPIVFMKDVSYNVMNDLLQFIYQGEVQVSQENFKTFIKTAESLQIRGLSNYGNDSTELNEKRISIESDISESQNSNELHCTSAKRPRLSEAPSTTLSATVKLESEENTPINEVQLKVEPIDQEDSLVGNISDDPLDEAIADDTNEDFWMTEEGDESHSGTDSNVLLEGEESIPSDIEETTVSSCMPEKPKEPYGSAFNRFEQWCSEHDVKTINEEVLLAYFKEKSLTCKPSSLGAECSMLKSMLSIKKNVNISSYDKLFAFLKNQNIGYQTKKSEMFKREDLCRFLRDANDYTYLMMKVVMIVGIAGSCSRIDLINLRMENVKDRGNFMQFSVPGSKTNNSRDFHVTAGNIKGVNLLDIIRKYIRLRPTNVDHGRFFIIYRNGNCIKQAVGVNTLGSMPKNVAQFLGLQNPEQFTAHCFKRNSAVLKECVTWMGSTMEN